jgi:hypothetical protein
MKTLGKSTKERQAITLFISIIFFLPFLIFFLFSQAKIILVIMLLYIIFMTVLNLIYSNVYEIEVGKESIVIKSLYRKIIVPSSEFQSITKVLHFSGSKFIPFPFMSPPYFMCNMKDGKSYIYVDMSLKAFFSSFSFDGNYLQRINKDIIRVIEQKET